MELLWTNSNPNSNFNEQNVSLSNAMNNYQWLLFEIKTQTAIDRISYGMYDIQAFKTESKYTLMLSGINTYFERAVAYVNDTTINIPVAKNINSGTGEETRTNSIIPLRIWGIKKLDLD